MYARRVSDDPVSEALADGAADKWAAYVHA
jgi:hypothetical protein